MSGGLWGMQEGPSWGPEAVMRRAGVSDNSSKLSLFSTYISNSPFLKESLFSIFPFGSGSGASNRRVRSSPVLWTLGPPGLAAAVVVLERRTSCPGTSAARRRPAQVDFYVAPRLVTCRGRIIMALGRFCRMGASRKQLKGIFLKFGDPGRHGPC